MMLGKFTGDAVEDIPKQRRSFHCIAAAKPRSAVLLDLDCGQSENEKILRSHPFTYLHIGAIERADREYGI